MREVWRVLYEFGARDKLDCGEHHEKQQHDVPLPLTVEPHSKLLQATHVHPGLGKDLEAQMKVPGAYLPAMSSLLASAHHGVADSPS